MLVYLCEKLFIDKKIVKLAAAGQHKNIVDILFETQFLPAKQMVTNKRFEYNSYHFFRITT